MRPSRVTPSVLKPTVDFMHRVCCMCGTITSQSYSRVAVKHAADLSFGCESLSVSHTKWHPIDAPCLVKKAITTQLADVRASSHEALSCMDLEGLMDPVLWCRSGDEGRPAPATDKPPTGAARAHKAGGAGHHRQPGRHIQRAHAFPLPSRCGGQHLVVLCSQQWHVDAFEIASDGFRHSDIAAVDAVLVTWGEAQDVTARLAALQACCSSVHRTSVCCAAGSSCQQPQSVSQGCNSTGLYKAHLFC